MSLYAPTTPNALTLSDLAAMKRRGEKIACLTAYDASFAMLLDQAGVDLILVGDSLGMVVQGHDSTLPVSVDDMAYHCACVSRARRRAFVVADMPFLSYTDLPQAAANAAKLMQQGGAQMVKLEGAHFETVAFLVKHGVPVCGHLGLQPQSVNQLGGYKVQGREPAAAQQILADAERLEQAGIGLLVLECVPAALGAQISARLKVPVIGIGAGPGCDGQVLVVYDMLNIGGGKRPRFSKDFLQQSGSVQAAIRAYIAAVKDGSFPNTEHCY